MKMLINGDFYIKPNGTTPPVSNPNHTSVNEIAKCFQDRFWDKSNPSLISTFMSQ